MPRKEESDMRNRKRGAAVVSLDEQTEPRENGTGPGSTPTPTEFPQTRPELLELVTRLQKRWAVPDAVKLESWARHHGFIGLARRLENGPSLQTRGTIGHLSELLGMYYSHHHHIFTPFETWRGISMKINAQDFHTLKPKVAYHQVAYFVGIPNPIVRYRYKRSKISGTLKPGEACPVAEDLTIVALDPNKP